MLRTEDVKWIRVDEGLIFEGTAEQFEHCFFEFNIEDALAWAEQNGLSIEMLDTRPPESNN